MSKQSYPPKRLFRSYIDKRCSFVQALADPTAVASVALNYCHFEYNFPLVMLCKPTIHTAAVTLFWPVAGMQLERLNQRTMM